MNRQCFCAGQKPILHAASSNNSQPLLGGSLPKHYQLEYLNKSRHKYDKQANCPLLCISATQNRKSNIFFATLVLGVNMILTFNDTNELEDRDILIENKIFNTLPPFYTISQWSWQTKEMIKSRGHFKVNMREIPKIKCIMLVLHDSLIKLDSINYTK